MKKITFIASLALISAVGYAQDFYKFSQRTATYTDLSNATSLNNGQPWDGDDFGSVSLPFQVEIFGQKLNQLCFDTAYFYLVDSQDNYAFLMPFSGYIVDRNFTFQGASQSPISYKVEGTTGNRILKLEVKNAGSGYEAENNQPSTLFVNYQVWLYEADKSIEYHYGNHNFTNLNMLNDENFYCSIFLYEGLNGDNAGVVTGALSNPTYGEFTDPVKYQQT